MNIEQNIPLSDKNWFKTGGSARFFCQPVTQCEFSDALRFARDHRLEVFVLGSGANILISDDGFDGLVIRPMLQAIDIDKQSGLVTAGAGVMLSDLIDTCLDHGISGLEEFSGIPSSIGGAVYINIHYFQFLLSHFLHTARIIDAVTCEWSDVDASWFNFGYNQSRLLEKKHYVTSATFQLKPIDAFEVMYAKGRRDEIIRHRAQRYPRSNTCGSFFRNFHASELVASKGNEKIPFVAYYLDKIGVKGALRVGNAVVSYQHANMLVAELGATTNDVVQLARSMQVLVRDAFGVTPQPECQFVGFKEYPLL